MFLFLKSQAMTIDPQWALLALNLLLVLVQTLSSSKDESEEDDRRGFVSGCEADVTEEEVSKNTKSLPQFNARERALLQFQRIKVEPLSPKYGYAASNDVQDLKENAAKIAAMIRKYSKRHSSKCKELKSAVSAISQETLKAPPPAQIIINDVAALGMPSEQRAYPSPSHSTPRTSCSSRRELKQAFISSPATSEGRSIKHLLRPSPSRSSFFSTEVTQEQVYSQPFTY